MEQRISHVYGLNQEITSAFGQTGPGSFFGIDSQVPSALRGNAEGFCVQALIRPNSALSADATIPFLQLICSSRDWAAETGWAMVYDPTISEVVMLLGDEELNATCVGFADTLITMNFDPAGVPTAQFQLYNNGELVDIAPTPANSVVGPAHFSIGGDLDPDAFAVDAGTVVGGANTTAIAGVWVGPKIDNAAQLPTGGVVTQQALGQMFTSIHDALDVVDAEQTPPYAYQASLVGPPAVTGESQPIPLASHIFSVRRGLPQLTLDTTQWIDEIAGTILTRRGTPTTDSRVLSARHHFETVSGSF